MQERTEWGHRFIWNNEHAGWESTSGNKVVVLPPSASEKHWRLAVAHLEQTYDFSGEDAERRAFCVAEGYTRQPLS